VRATGLQGWHTEQAVSDAIQYISQVRG